VFAGAVPRLGKARVAWAIFFIEDLFNFGMGFA
jgi:hypothetical protein